MLGAPALLADTNQVVILSSAARSGATPRSSNSRSSAASTCSSTRMYNNRRIAALPAPGHAVGRRRQPGRRDHGAPPRARRSTGRWTPARCVLARAIDGMDWRLMMFPICARCATRPSSTRRRPCWWPLILVLLGAVLRAAPPYRAPAARGQGCCSSGPTPSSRKTSPSRTRDLTDANRRLRNEVAERVTRRAQPARDPGRAACRPTKMAMLGQIATGITHELTQPLGAIRTLSGNAVEFMRRGEFEEVPGNLQHHRPPGRPDGRHHPAAQALRAQVAARAGAGRCRARRRQRALPLPPRAARGGRQVVNRCVAGRRRSPGAMPTGSSRC